ncbi:MAG: HD domain-containing protein, partial [Spirochaetaceae bacterium]|nr:HD domain-containing protein [Spirochaetaceae bacterium]
MRELGGIFRAHGKKAYLVGGAVRDMVLGQTPADYDLATDAKPEEVTRIFKRVIPTGIKHGTVTVRHKGRSIEVTTFRTDGLYTDGRRPDSVSYAATIDEDLSRRDFTINAMALELPDGNLIDPCGGRADIERRLIRCVGASEERFSEDGLRPLRAIRFCAQLAGFGFTLDDELLAAIPKTLDITAKVSPERVACELTKTISCAAPLEAFRYMEKTGLMRLILPELATCRAVTQGGLHRFDVLDHSLYALEWACAHNYPLTIRLAALFHDLGKPACARPGAGKTTFYTHEKESARLTRALLFRLRYPNTVIDAVTHLVEEHMFHYTPDWSAGAVRRFIVRAGEDSLEPLFCLRMADTYAFTREAPPQDLLADFTARIETVLRESRALSLKDLAINGHDITALGITDGKRIGA